MSSPQTCCAPCPSPTTTQVPGPGGLNAYTTTTVSFVVPPVGNQVGVTVVNSDWMVIGETVIIEGAGLFEVIATPSSTTATLEYLNVASNTQTGTNIGSGARVGPAGTASDGTNGQDAFSVTTVDFVVPAISGSVAVSVANSQWATVGQNIFIEDAGYFELTAKSDDTHMTLTYLDVSFNVNAGNNIPAGAGVSPAGPDLANPLTISRGGTNATTVAGALANLGLGFSPLVVYAAGTSYQLTATPALLDFGTTDPSLTITSPGTYLIFGRVRVDYNGATFAAVRTGTLKLRRTNNTAADLTNGSTSFLTDVITTLTYTLATISLAPVVYVTTNSTDIIQIFGSISVVPTAGSLDTSEACIVAVKLFDQTL